MPAPMAHPIPGDAGRPREAAHTPPTVRARVAPRPEPPYDRLFDAVTQDLVTDGPIARERFPVRWSDTDGLRRLAAAKRAPLGAELARELADYHRRLGASAGSLGSLERLGAGAVVCAVAGQQPAPLGGPLYTLHKIAGAVGAAAAVAERTGTPCVPVFWMHGEDSDFEEVRGATFAGPGLDVRQRALPDDAHVPGGMVGSIPAAALGPVTEEALAAWNGLPGAAETAVLLRDSRARADDLGEAFSALVLALFGAQGLVVVDPRLPAFRAAARPVLERYLARAEDLAAAAGAAGDRLEALTGRRALPAAALESFVFAVEGGVRRKLTLAEARGAAGRGTLSPSVALRTAVQDAVLPTVAMACGPGEIAYLAQLREVFAGLGVEPACPVPRPGVTWLPRAAVELLEVSGADAWELVADADAVLRRLAERGIPAGPRADLEGARAGASEGLERLARSAREVDASLPQLVESARAKVDYQFQRVLEGVAGKVRHRLEREHAEWPRLRHYLLPGDRLQERRLASLEIVAHRGAAVADDLCGWAVAHARALAGGVHEHLVAEL
jgi:bacillithiol synthase